MAYTIAQLAERLGRPYQGNGNLRLERASSWEDAGPDAIVFAEKGHAEPGHGAGAPGCVLAPAELLGAGVNGIVSERPKLDFARAAAILLPRPRGSGLRDPSAKIARTAAIADDVDIGPYAVVGAHVTIGSGTILHAGVVLGDGVRIGEECILYPRVVLYDGAELGNRVTLHSGAVIGSDGFGFVSDGPAQVKFPQLGKVVLDDDVEIGANTTVDRGSLGTTRIGSCTKIDNLVQIAHNVQIGKSVVIAAQTGISGSTVIEDNAIIGGQVGFGDHARVQKGAVIGSKAGVLPGKIVRSGDVYWGVPVRPLREYKTLNALFGRLPEMKADIVSLKKELVLLRTTVAKIPEK